MADRNSTRASILNQLKSKPTGHRYSTDEYILLASDAHYYRYTYEKTEYKTAQEFITVTCPGHGDFEVRATRHLHNNRGCPTCFPDKRGYVAKSNSYKKSRFIEKAIEKHGSAIDYSALEYLGSDKLTFFTCKKHGGFKQSPSRHLRADTPCPECRNEEISLTLDKFIERSTAKHHGKFDYSKVNFEKCTDKVVIICPIHGEFVQSLSSHMQGTTCKKCYLDERRLDTECFIERAKEAHKDRGSDYDYSKVNYTGCKVPVEIICKDHGSFWQRPNEHLKPHGCPECGNNLGGGWSRSDFIAKCQANNNGNATLYVVKCSKGTESFYKVGVTSHDVKWRFKSKRNMPYNYKTVFEIEADGGYIYDLEVRLHSLLKDNKHRPLIDFRGKTECFNTISPIAPLLRELTASEQLQLIA